MNRFIYADPHFKQANIYRFRDNENNLIRPWATNFQEADEMMVEAFNAEVKKGDTTYFLGDIAYRREGIDLLGRMNGRKILIRGNHDIFKLKYYLEHVADIRGTHKINRLILSHYPIHPNSIPRWCQANVHGHTHANLVMRRSILGRRIPDRRYFNACIEQIGLKPISIEDAEMRIAAFQQSGRWSKSYLMESGEAGPKRRFWQRP